MARAQKFRRRNFQKPLLVGDGGTIQIAGSRMGPIGFLVETGLVGNVVGFQMVTEWSRTKNFMALKTTSTVSLVVYSIVYLAK